MTAGPAAGSRLRRGRVDEIVASVALVLMAVIPIVEIVLRPGSGSGVENAPVVVQHLVLVLAMFGAVAALRTGHVASFGNLLGPWGGARFTAWTLGFGKASAALVCGVLCLASVRLVASEAQASHALAYGIPVWWVQASMPAGFLWLGTRLASDTFGQRSWTRAAAVIVPAAGAAVAYVLEGTSIAFWAAALWLVALLSVGAPIFVVLGGLALALFWKDGLPLASVALSHYQITVNPSLPALPLFTLAGLVFARTGAAHRLGQLFVAMFGGGMIGTVVATGVLCSMFTALTGGSGVTILALGGLLLPLLRKVGYPEQRGIGLVTSASALGVLLAPSVPLIMYAIIARVPIANMFLAGLLPAVLMVACLLLIGGFLREQRRSVDHASVRIGGTESTPPSDAAWAAKWELMAPVVAIGSLVGGFATPTESAAITVAYAILTQALAHRELTPRLLANCLSECAQIVGGVMLILGMALGLTNYLVEAGIPDAAIEWAQHFIPGKLVFLLLLNVFLFAAGALMEIFAAIVVLVPLLLPVALSYGIDPVHFGIIFLANMEMGFLCPPAGMNIYFASAMFGKPVRFVSQAVLPALLAIFIGTLVISWLPVLATGLPRLLLPGSA